MTLVTEKGQSWYFGARFGAGAAASSEARPMIRLSSCAAALLTAGVVTFSSPAEACGCFAPPDPATPVVQAGERILFAVENGKVTAHIQIQYAGNAKDFGWIVPLPSVPVVKAGTDELFTQLLATTTPSYKVENDFSGAQCPQATGGFALGCGGSPVALNRAAGPPTQEATPSPVVVQSTVGSFEYAVLKADDKAEMLKWLADNRYFIPTGTEDVIGPYVRPGAFFLALKLQSGASTGDITPIVLEYASQLPMVPIILTSVAAQPNMGIQVWLLGNGRAVPRNYHHVVVNDAELDWLSGVDNYAAVVTKAVAETPEKHAFVTEYAGPSAPMRDKVVTRGQFGTEENLASATTPGDFVTRLLVAGFGRDNVLPPVVRSVFFSQLPYPPALEQAGVSRERFLQDVDYFLGTFRQQRPELFTGYTSTFDAPSLARAVFAQYVTPMRELNQLFTTHPKLTRLFTTLSPADMTRDPVFSFNATLPDVPREHTAKLKMGCGSSTLVTEQGVELQVVGQQLSRKATPKALRIETVLEEGAPTVMTDNASVIVEAYKPAAAAMTPPMQGCSVVDPTSLGLLVLVAKLRRQRKGTRS